MFSLILPVFNEQQTLKSDYLKNLSALLENIYQDFEIIVVNDGSQDQTKELLYEQKKNIPKLKIINHYLNKGYGSSLKNGINFAKFDTIVISDLDETYPYQQIPNLLKIYAKSAEDNGIQLDMVVGQRTGKNYWEGFAKTFLRLILLFIVEFSTGNKVPDINSGLRVFSKKTITKYFKVLSNHFSFTTSATLSYLLNNHSIYYYKIDYFTRKGEDNKSKVKLIKDSLRTLQSIVELLIVFNPLKLFLIVSSAFLILSSILLLALYFSNFIIFKILSITFFFFSILSFLISLLSVLLKKNY
jgi:glycosyltransferase involved in cell wall biosynthesis